MPFAWVTEAKPHVPFQASPEQHVYCSEPGLPGQNKCDGLGARWGVSAERGVAMACIYPCDHSPAATACGPQELRVARQVRRRQCVEKNTRCPFHSESRQPPPASLTNSLRCSSAFRHPSLKLTVSSASTSTRKLRHKKSMRI